MKWKADGNQRHMGGQTNQCNAEGGWGKGTAVAGSVFHESVSDGGRRERYCGGIVFFILE
jgi:hypothetical protein